MISAALLAKQMGMGNKDLTDERVVGNVQEKSV